MSISNGHLVLAGALLVGLFLLVGTGMVSLRAINVRRRDLAEGLRPELLAFLDWWEANGPFPVTIATDPNGGLRTDEAEQEAYYAQGLSKARTLAETPHGRGAAVDLWPVDFDPNTPWARQPDAIKAEFRAVGAAAKAQGLVWGGDWASLSFPNGDQPHIEIRNWTSLPYPPEGLA